MNKSDPYESLACDCVEIGTLISDQDNTLTLEIVADETTSAMQKCDRIEQVAKSIGSGNCVAQRQTNSENPAKIVVTLEFDCTAERLIFEMKQRSLSL